MSQNLSNLSTQKYFWGLHSNANIDDLPTEMIHHILTFCTYREAIALSCISKQFVDVNEVNRLWRLFFHYEFHTVVTFHNSIRFTTHINWTTRKFKDFKERFMKIKRKQYLQRHGSSIESRRKVLLRMHREQQRDIVHRNNLLYRARAIESKIQEKNAFMQELGNFEFDKFHLKEYQEKMARRNKTKKLQIKNRKKRLREYTNNQKKLLKKQKLSNNKIKLIKSKCQPTQTTSSKH